ncbi:MAG: response regulator [Alphaproteobacteria bacterium]|nr:response regulator [Alphaproteobacteria bacterium]
MLNKHSIHRPDRQLEKTLIALVYSVVAMSLSILMLFIFPQYSLYLLVLILVITILSILLAISVLSASENALTYGGFANEVLKSNDIILQIDNIEGYPVIQNQPAKSFFSGENVLEKIKNSLINERQNILNFQRLEQALKNLKTEKVSINLNVDEKNQWFEISLRPIYLKKSDIFEGEFSLKKIIKETYFLWSLENVTAHKNMEHIFENERKNLHDFIHNMPIGLYIANSDYDLEYVNETFAIQLGQQRESLLGKKLKDLVLKDNGILDSKIPTYSGRTIFCNELSENSEMFVVQNNFKDDNKIKIRGLTVKDLQNDKVLLEKLNYGVDEIDWLFNLTPLGIIFIDNNGNIKSFNQKATEILEKSGNDLAQRNLKDFLQISTLKLLHDIFKRYENNKENTEINVVETRLKSDKIVKIHIAPRKRIHCEKSFMEGYVLYLSDTTEEKNLELKFAQAQKMQAMGQLAGGVAHDFNNLLTAMIGFCDLLLQRHGIGDPSFADLNQVRNNAHRAANLVRQLLAFSRKQPLKPKLIDVTENFIELNYLLKRTLGEQISLEFHHGTDLGYIRVDPVQFSQVIVNLVVNAKDAMNGKGTLKISTHTEKLTAPYQFGADTIARGEFVVINVSDTGCGIAKENLNRIFEPFFSTKENVVGSGTGLGLATVYGIIRQTEGFIKVYSTIGVGTTFSIYLPRFETKDDDGDNIVENQSLEQTPVLTSMTNPKSQKMILGMNVLKLDRSFKPMSAPDNVKILFAEDEDSVRAFGVRALKKKGFSVVACNCAESAIELLDKGENFDLLITDMVMPGLSGADLAKIAKQKLPDIKIILASGYSEEIARKELSGSEEFEFIAKPYSLVDLIQKVFNILNNRQKDE